VEDFSKDMIIKAGIVGVHSLDFGDIHRPSAKSRLSARHTPQCGSGDDKNYSVEKSMKAGLNWKIRPHPPDKNILM
jgi:hypothetical protein